MRPSGQLAMSPDQNMYMGMNGENFSAGSDNAPVRLVLFYITEIVYI